MTGTLVPGTRLPTERSLAEEFKVSRTSVREALSELESKHLIERVQGRGSEPHPDYWTEEIRIR